MNSYWKFAHRLLRYRATIVGAVGFAFLSAGGMGFGILGSQPLLEVLLGEAKGLREMVGEWLTLHPPPAWLPTGWVQSLPTDPFISAVWIMLALGLLTVFGAACNFLHQYLSLTVVYRTVTNIRRQGFHHVVRLPLKDVIAGGTSDAMARVVNDAFTLGAGFNAMLSRGMAQALRGLAALVVALVIDFWLASIALLLAVPLGLIIRKLGRIIRRASRASLAAQAGLFAAATEALQGLRVVKVHTTERYEAGRFHRINKKAMHELLRVRTARALGSPLVETVAIFALGALMLIPMRAIISHNKDPHEFILTLGALAIAGASLKPLTGILSDIQVAYGAADRLSELLKWKREPGHDPRLPRMPRHASTIEFREVTFTYPRAHAPSLDRVSLTIPHGRTYAFVGPNGSGKTTLLAMVPRLFDPDTGGGGILIDGTDIRRFNIRSVRRQIGAVTQETVLFRGTIRSNIAYGAEGATEEKIVEAARRARAHEFIARLPKAYDTPVGEMGLTLSGGQRQRLAIARAILRDPAILILDEATSMIDADSEAQIAAAIAEFAAGRTCLIVAHRLSTVMNADLIVVMDRGRIVDVGRHPELLDRCDVYRLIAKNQLFASEPPGSAPRPRETVA